MFYRRGIIPARIDWFLWSIDIICDLTEQTDNNMKSTYYK